MICGIGIDMTTVERFLTWIEKPEMIDRFFNKEEQCSNPNIIFQKEHYAARFAAKEAFGKALGTGITGFNLSDVYIKSEANGKPILKVMGSAQKKLKEIFGDCKLHVSLSHERNNAVAVVIIEK
ncbi:MAG: holo-ACP synthase [Treponema sp.]|nr:holo-ACP synthase [Treponema sp.]